MTTCRAINSFDGDYRFLSNFYPSVIEWRGKEWLTVEQAYQAAKTRDKAEVAKIRAATTPTAAKRLGRTLTLRDDWDEIKLKVMKTLVRRKFDMNEPLADMLLATGKAQLVEGNWWGDVYWGVCRGVGENHLGKILMAERSRQVKKRLA